MPKPKTFDQNPARERRILSTFLVRNSRIPQKESKKARQKDRKTERQKERKEGRKEGRQEGRKEGRILSITQLNVLQLGEMNN